MKKRIIIRYLLLFLKILVALAAAVNLVALFVYHYETPSWLRREEEETVLNTPAAIDSELVSPTVDPNGPSAHFSIPVVPVNYSGEADMDTLVLNGVYVQGSDDQPIEDARITYEIFPGESRLKKTIQYTAKLPDGEILTETRTMNLTARYTGPTISLLGVLPALDPDDADVFAGRLSAKNVIRADDGFGNDAAEMVEAVFDGLSDENPDAQMTLKIENQVHDTYELELTVQVENYSGVVLTLTDHRITLTVGDDFDPWMYISYAHDAAGNDITDYVDLASGVDTDYPGEYEVWYWVQDYEGTYSPTKKLFVTVEPAPEETWETETEAP